MSAHAQAPTLSSYARPRTWRMPGEGIAGQAGIGRRRGKFRRAASRQGGGLAAVVGPGAPVSPAGAHRVMVEFAKRGQNLRGCKVGPADPRAIGAHDCSTRSIRSSTAASLGRVGKPGAKVRQCLRVRQAARPGAKGGDGESEQSVAGSAREDWGRFPVLCKIVFRRGAPAPSSESIVDGRRAALFYMRHQLFPGFHVRRGTSPRQVL